MSTPGVDAATDDEARLLLREASMVTLVASGGTAGGPVVVPTHFGLDGTGTDPWPVIEVHLRRAHPLWAALEAAGPRAAVTVSVVGPFVFVPHDWNHRPGRSPAQGVPTSWYVTAALTCRAEVVGDDRVLAQLLERVSARYEPVGLDAPVVVGEEPYGPMLGAIRGLRLHVESVAAKAKLGGNRPLERRIDIARRLSGRGGPGDAEAVAWLERVLERDADG